MTVAVLMFLLMLMFPPFALASMSAWMFVSPRLRMRPRLRRVRVLVLLLLACAAGGAVGVESFWDASERAGLLGGEASFAVICVTFALSGVAASVRVRDAERQATDDLARERLHSGERDRFGQSTTAPHV